jgi:hypothetical protein
MATQNKIHNYSEADLILLFHLNRITEEYTPLMQEWTNATTTLTEFENTLF